MVGYLPQLKLKDLSTVFFTERLLILRNASSYPRRRARWADRVAPTDFRQCHAPGRGQWTGSGVRFRTRDAGKLSACRNRISGVPFIFPV
jgi:hypothetical protein